MIPYARGEVTAGAYKNETERARYTLRSTEKATCLKITAEDERIICDNRDIAFFAITVTDKDGNTVTDGGHKIKCSVSGGELLCLYSGDPCNEDDYTSKICHTFEGHALAAVRTNKTGTVTVTVYSDTLASDSTSIPAKKRFCRRYINEADKQS